MQTPRYGSPDERVRPDLELPKHPFDFDLEEDDGADVELIDPETGEDLRRRRIGDRRSGVHSRFDPLAVKDRRAFRLT